MLRLAEFRPELGRALVGEAVDDLLGRVGPAGRAPPARARGTTELIEALAARPTAITSPSSRCYDDVDGARSTMPRRGWSRWACSAIGPTS